VAPRVTGECDVREPECDQQDVERGEDPGKRDPAAGEADRSGVVWSVAAEETPRMFATKQPKLPAASMKKMLGKKNSSAVLSTRLSVIACAGT
jgi:hypothetical protein